MEIFPELLEKGTPHLDRNSQGVIIWIFCQFLTSLCIKYVVLKSFISDIIRPSGEELKNKLNYYRGVSNSMSFLKQTNGSFWIGTHNKSNYHYRKNISSKFDVPDAKSSENNSIEASGQELFQKKLNYHPSLCTKFFQKKSWGGGLRRGERGRGDMLGEGEGGDGGERRGGGFI